ncbi:MAG: MFS transporter [Bacteroidales bacterium]|nr:MFS transporter [Bacteroidales bacterium]
MEDKRINAVGNAIVPFIVMLFLYFIIGVFTVINQQFQVPLKSAMLPGDGNITNALVTLLNFSWFLAYPLSEGFASKWLDRYGYRKTSVWALLILITGLAVYESAVLLHVYKPTALSVMGNKISTGFFVFLLGSFIVGISMTVLQVVLNLYLDVCSVGKTTALQRQMIGGTTNSVGMALAPLIVSYIIFAGTPLHLVRSEQFILPFICLMGIVLIVTWVTGKVKMPDISRVATSANEVLEKSIWSFSHLKLGLWGLFFYVGIEVAVGANINMYAVQLGGKYAPAATAMATLYWTLLLAGRFVSSLFKNISSRSQLTVASLCASVLLVLAMIFSNPWILAGIGLFHSVMWPAIFTLAVDKLGKYTTKASGVLMIGVVGGGIIPFIQGVMADWLHGDWRWTWIPIVFGEIYILYYAVKGSRIKQTP